MLAHSLIMDKSTFDGRENLAFSNQGMYETQLHLSSSIGILHGSDVGFIPLIHGCFHCKNDLKPNTEIIMLYATIKAEFPVCLWKYFMRLAISFRMLGGNMIMNPFGRLSFHCLAEGISEKCSAQRPVEKCKSRV